MDIQLLFETYRASCNTKHAALYQAVKEAIKRGSIAYGSKLPSTRRLAQSYGLSRGTVNAVYDTLATEGYVSFAAGSGTGARKRRRFRSPRGGRWSCRPGESG